MTKRKICCRRALRPLLSGSLILLTALCAGCGKDPGDDPGPQPGEHADAQANRWSYSILKDYYLWNDEVAATTPDYNQAYDAFFSGLLLPLRTNVLDGKGAGSSRRLYSYLERKASTRSKSVSPFDPIYGFEFIVYGFTMPTGSRYLARVLYTVAGSPADKAGLRRGDWIGRINGAEIHERNFSDLNLLFAANSSSVALSRVRLDYDETDGVLRIADLNETLPLVVAPVEDAPIHLARMVTTPGGRKVGYLMLNAFQPGYVDDDPAHAEYDDALRALFAKWCAAGVDRLILDLRYNPGGYVSTAQLLASLIVPASKLGTRFVECRTNAHRKDFGYDFLSSKKVSGMNLSLEEIHVIATKSTASASEMVMVGLRGVGVDVVHVGAPTEGKNVGMELFNKRANGNEALFGGYAYTMRPITFQVYNAAGFTDYASGLTPDIPFNELMSDTDLYWLDWGELGTTDDPLLARTLAVIDGTVPASAVRSVRHGAGIGVCTLFTSVEHNPRAGLKASVPGEDETAQP